MKPIFIVCFLLSQVNIYTVAKAQNINLGDSLALVDLYNNTNGALWTNNNNWLTASPVSTWFGVTVTGDRVTEINLYPNNLQGPIPASIGNLSNLKTLQLRANKLSGVIPETVGRLYFLQLLDLTDNQLSGSIPDSVGYLINLVVLSLPGNNLSGNIPSALSHLYYLQWLDLSNNNLTGSIPPSFGNLGSIHNIYIDNNQLSDSIPSSLGKLVQLSSLHLSNNKLTGSIPPALGNLVYLAVLDLSNNQLTGTIPSSVGNLTVALYLRLNDNLLSGAIPQAIGNMKQLVGVYLQNNRLSARIPPAIGDLQNLQYLYLDNNLLTGGIPASFKNFASTYISINHNKLFETENYAFNNFPVNNLVTGDFTYNRFNFNGLEFLSSKYPLINYGIQAIIHLHKNDSSLSVNAGGTLRNNTYTWFRAGSNETKVIKGDSVFKPTQNGKYYAQIVNSIATKLILHTDTINYIMPSVIQSAAIDLNAFSDDVSRFIVYPNPAKDIIHIKTINNAVITVTDAQGKIVIVQTVNKNATLNVGHLANGVYYLKNSLSGDRQKLIIEH